MIIRHQFRSRLKASSIQPFAVLLQGNSEKLVDFFAAQLVNFVRIFQFDAEVYLYLEGEKSFPSIEWPDYLLSNFETWPSDSGPRSSVALMDIFHDATPRKSEPWRASNPGRESVGSIIYLRPEKYASYVFYHFQLQEEGNKKFNKYFIIGSNENLLFSYYELPALVDSYNADRILQTSQSPNGWAELMAEHFAPWSDGLNVENPWKVMNLVFSRGS